MNNIEQNKKTFTIPFAITLIFSILLVVCLFLPYSTATESYAELLNSYSDTVIYEEIDMNAKDVVNVSLFEYYKIYTNVGAEFFGSASFASFYAGLIVVIGAFSLLTLLFSVLKKSIPTIVFSVLSFATFYIQCWDYSDRGVVPSENYDLGIGCYLFYIASIAVLVGAIWLLICKKNEKKARIN